MLKEAERETPEIFDRLFRLVGKLNYTFTNTESLLIHVIAGLAGVTKDTASIIFLTLNTTRARINLVERLAKHELISPELRRNILEITQTMNETIRIKNKYNHCIYSFDSEAGKASTILMRVFDKKDAIKYGQTDHLNEEEIGNLKQTIEDIETLNRRIWEFLVANKFPL